MLNSSRSRFVRGLLNENYFFYNREKNEKNIELSLLNPLICICFAFFVWLLEYISLSLPGKLLSG